MSNSASKLNQADEFQPLHWEDTTLGRKNEFRPTHPSTAPELHELENFQVSRRFWESIQNDSVLKRDFEKLLNEKVEERLQSCLAQEREQRFNQAREQGFDVGLAEAQRAARGHAEVVDRMASQLLEQKEQILHRHEKEWCKALEHLLRRFLVAGRPRILSEIEAWLQETLLGYARDRKVCVFVCPTEFKVLSELLVEGTGPRWQLYADPSLKSCEIRAECDGDGVFFCPEGELTRLEKWVETYFAKESGA